MDESSLLQTRFKTDTESANHDHHVQPSADGHHVKADHPDGPSPTEVVLAESFLIFINSALSCGVPIQTRLDPVQLLHTLGSGATFTVKRALRSSLNEPSRVVKVLKHSHHADAQRFNQSAYSALMRELAALSHPPLRNHKNVVTLHSVGCAVQSRSPLDICPSLFMEEALHRTLAEFEKSGVVLDAGARRRLCLNVSEGLSAIHACGIVHGDIKAGNVLVFEDAKDGYVAKIADFGCAVFMDKYRDSDPSTRVRLPGISQPWAAPEAEEPVPVGSLPLTDVYSLGLLIFRILVYTDPFGLFDLPPDRELRAAAISELRLLPKFPLLIAQYIQAHTRSRWSRSERLVFNTIFSGTLDLRPANRDLPLVVGLLRLLLRADSGLDYDQVVQCVEDCASTPVWGSSHGALGDVSAALQLATVSNHSDGYAKTPTELLPEICFDEESLWDLPLDVRREIRDSLWTLFDHVCQSHRDGRLPYNQPIRESIYWTLFKFHLRGLGDYLPDAASALDVLYEAGTLGEESWRAWALLYLLHRALRVPVCSDRRNDILYWTARARATEGFTQRLLTPCFEEEYHRRVNSEGLGASPDKLDAFEALFDPENPGFYAHVGLDGVLDDYGSGNTVLHIAAVYGFLDVVKFAIENGAADVNAQNDMSETPLMFACRYGRTDIAHYLLDNGADASIETPALHINALYWLSSLPSDAVPEMASKLTKGGASLQHLFLDREKHVELFDQGEYLFTGRALRSPILRAIGNGDLAATKVLFRLGMEALSDENPLLAVRHCFLQPMRLAALFHHHDILEFLCGELEIVFKAIWDKRAPATQPSQPKFLGQFSNIMKTNAIPREALDTKHHIERLCIHGADWETACAKTLEVLLKYGFLRDTVGVLAESGREYSVSTLTACISEFRNTAALRFLVSQQTFAPLVNELENRLGVVSLYPVDAALDCGNLEAFRVLVDAGAELDLARKPDPAHRLSPVGASYLHVCASLRIGNVEFVERILDAGVPPNVADRKGISALTLAVMKGAFAVADKLMEKGASVNSPGAYGYTTLGFLLEPVSSAQCDDLVASIRYLLNLMGSNTPSFIVREGNVPCLGLAANSYNPSGPQIECFRMLLDKFSSPEQINARGSNPPYSTPLQVAIANHNLPAVRALIKTGVVDLSSPDHYGKTPMDQAISSLNKLQTKTSALSETDRESDRHRAREIVSLIASTRSWPSNAAISTRISSLVSSCSELLATMKTLPHWQRKHAGLLSALTRTIDGLAPLSFPPQSPGADDCYYEQEEKEEAAGNDKILNRPTLDAFVEFARQLNLALAPVAFADLCYALVVKPSSNDINHASQPRARAAWLPAGSSSAEQAAAAAAAFPTLGNLTLKSFRAWRQAALFELVLDHVRSGGDGDGSGGWRAFAGYVGSGYDTGQLPYDADFVRYPQTLLSWYEDRGNYDQLDLREQGEREMVERFVAGLRRRRAEEVEGRESADGGVGGGRQGIIALTPFSEEFKRFHFFDVNEGDGTVEVLDVGRLEGILSVTTQCICMKPGEEIGTVAEATVKYADLLLQNREGCFGPVGSGRWGKGSVRSRLMQMEAEVRAAERDYERAMEQL